MSRLPRSSLRPEASPEPSLAELARRELGTALPAADLARDVGRVVIEVRLGERTELVTVSRSAGRLAVSATDAPSAGAASPASRLALAWLAGEAPRASITPLHSLPPAMPRPGLELAARLSDLAVAIARSGVEIADPASVREALPRVVAELPSPPPIAIARWLGRLVTALAEADARQVARLLSAVVGPAIEGDDKVLGWPFAAEELPFSDRRFVELARECIDAYGGEQIERRVLADEETGELVLEERYVAGSPSAREASIGPCPRRLEVGLGILRQGLPPQLRAQQYTVSSGIPSEAWDRVEALACTVPVAQSAALAALAAHPAAAEPLALIVAPTFDDGELTDGDGNRIPISKEDPGAAEALAIEAKRERLGWVLVRWATRESGIAAVPLAAAHRQGAGWRHVRLR